MEDEDSATSHQMPQLVEVVQESALQQILVVDIHGTLYVTIGELIVKSAVHDNDRMRLAPH